MMRIAVVCLLAACSLASGEPLVSPKFQQMVKPAAGIVHCKFRTPLVACRLRLSEHFYHSFDKVLDFDRGTQSQKVGLYYYATASYAGSSLAAGDCGVEIVIQESNRLVLVECFGKSEDGDWTRGFSLFTSHSWQLLPASSLTPTLIVTDPGTDVAVLLRAQEALTNCFIMTPNVERLGLPPGHKPSPTSRFREYGGGAEHGDCGAMLTNVNADDAGVWFWHGQYMDAWPYQIVRQASVVLVTAAPKGDPELEVQDLSQLHAGSQLTAVCRAPPSVPPSNLIWFLDGQMVRRDDSNATQPGDVAKTLPWLPMPSVQTYTRRLTASDLGKRLECRIEHPALPTVRIAGVDLPGALP